MCLEEQVKGGTKDQGKVGKNFSDEVHLEKHQEDISYLFPQWNLLTFLLNGGSSQGSELS